MIGPRSARVRSKSQAETWYAVDLEDRSGAGSCTCKGFTVRKSCRHLDAVRGFVSGSAVTAADDQPFGWEGDLATSRYQSGELIVRSGLVPVRVTLGHPRFALKGYTIAASVMEAAPKGLKDIEDDDEFARLYRERLDSFGAGWFARRFAEILREHPKSPGIVLLCYEDLSKPGEYCHRRTFADWWHERTQQVVPELGAVMVQEALA